MRIERGTIEFRNIIYTNPAIFKSRNLYKAHGENSGLPFHLQKIGAEDFFGNTETFDSKDILPLWVQENDKFLIGGEIFAVIEIKYIKAKGGYTIILRKLNQKTGSYGLQKSIDLHDMKKYELYEI